MLCRNAGLNHLFGPSLTVSQRGHQTAQDKHPVDDAKTNGKFMPSLVKATRASLFEFLVAIFASDDE